MSRSGMGAAQTTRSCKVELVQPELLKFSRSSNLHQLFGFVGVATFVVIVVVVVAVAIVVAGAGVFVGGGIAG